MDNINLQTKKIFLYARKSTDEPERQVLSIEAQMFELREFAKKEGLNIVREFVESKTAKEPGREIFNEMIASIEKNEAEGILAWHPFMSTPSFISGTFRRFIWSLGRWNCTSVVLVFERLKHTVSQLSFKTPQCPEFGLALG